MGRAIISALHRPESDEGIDQVFKFQRLEVKTRPRVRVYADNLLVGRTPATITAELSAVKVLMPK